MNSSEQKIFDVSIQVYRRLLRVYPAGFLNEFGEQLVQTFGDLARRALHAGGTLRLMLLWMRILPDLGVSAIREHFSGAAWLCPPHVRWRWVMACTFGFGIGSLVGNQTHGWLGEPYAGLARSLCLMVILGFLQSTWALKRPTGDVLRWTAATAMGVFLFALPFRIAVFGWSWPPDRLSMASQITLNFWYGAGIGLLQFFILPKNSLRAWRWIPANAFGFVAVALAFLPFIYGVNSELLRSYAFAFPFTGGAIYGCLTALPLGSILDSKDANSVEGAVQS